MISIDSGAVYGRGVDETLRSFSITHDLMRCITYLCKMISSSTTGYCFFKCLKGSLAMVCKLNRPTLPFLNMLRNPPRRLLLLAMTGRTYRMYKVSVWFFFKLRRISHFFATLFINPLIPLTINLGTWRVQRNPPRRFKIFLRGFFVTIAFIKGRSVKNPPRRRLLSIVPLFAILPMVHRT